MKFGICDSNLDRIPIAAAAGADYVELAVSGNLMPLEPDEVWEPVRQQIMALPLKPEAFNNFFPGAVRVTGPDVDWAKVEAYAARAIQRAAMVGGKVMVVGSGGARNVPDGFSWDEAWAQLRHLFQMMGPIAAKWGITIVIEPLRRQESNIVNLVTEGLRMAREVNHPNIKALADFYHMDELGEPLEHLLDAGPDLGHVHVADTGRFRPGSGVYPYPTFFRYLKQAGYDRRISMENRWDYDHLQDEMQDSLRFLREQWEKA